MTPVAFPHAPARTTARLRIAEQSPSWKRRVAVPVAAVGLMLLAGCGQGNGEEPAESQESAESQEPAEGQEPADDGADGNEPAEGALTMAQVEENDSTDSCWAAIDGSVYDLSDWIEDHPGGPSRIEGLCGTDATDAFQAQHEGQDAPEEQLAEFEIGVLQD